MWNYIVKHDPLKVIKCPSLYQTKGMWEAAIEMELEMVKLCPPRCHSEKLWNQITDSCSNSYWVEQYCR
jgi:hypothetical protein